MPPSRIQSRIATYQADLKLESGSTLPNARLVYAVYGQLNSACDNVVVFPTRFGATHTANEFLIGPGRALDTNRYFVVVPNMLGNGESSSPSNIPAPFDGPRFPAVTTRDNVRFQRQMLEAVFGVDKLALVVGWSMGGLQAYQWGFEYPDAVDRLHICCATAVTSEHNIVFLESLRAALQADAAFHDGDYVRYPTDGMRAVGRIYAGWAYSQAWYRQRGYRQLGYDSLDDYLPGYWDRLFMAREPNDLMAMIDSWITHDISGGSRGDVDLSEALSRIKARTVLMPCDHDLYFRVADNRSELSHLPNARLEVLESVWGHMAASGQNVEATERLAASIRGLLAEEPGDSR